MREKIRSEKFGKFQVTLYDTGTTDRRGRTGLAWQVKQDGEIVARSGKNDLVYGSPMHADDSNATLLAAISLIVHSVTYDEDDQHVDPGWDAEELEELAAMELEGEEEEEEEEEGEEEEEEDDVMPCGHGVGYHDPDDDCGDDPDDDHHDEGDPDLDW